MQTLKHKLLTMDGKGYKQYKELQGKYVFGDYTLYMDYIQGDPFASPSRIRIELKNTKELLDKDAYSTPWRKVAVEDFLAREVARAIKEVVKKGRGSGKSGLIYIDEPGQEILQRTAVKVTENVIEVRLSIGLPASGRSILAKEAISMLFQDIPKIIKKGIINKRGNLLRTHLILSDQQQAIRQYLKEHRFIAFVANGSILPRESGISNKPLANGVPFVSPASMEISIPVPHQDVPVKGLGIPEGITLIVGGGYHGKSTLLKALERGVYHHIPGDGRELVLTRGDAVKIRAEDGRKITKVNLTLFINNLPFGQNTQSFESEDASGSTSQAANIVEAVEGGSKLLLMDEDTSATNFMIRDVRMQKLVSKEKEPITPFLDQVKRLRDKYGVSTILVLGGSGDYFDVADHVIMMDEYKPIDVTIKAKEISRLYQNQRKIESADFKINLNPRVPLPEGLLPMKGHKEKVDAKGLYHIMYGKTVIDLSLVEQLVDDSQTRAIAEMIRYAAKKYVDGKKSLIDIANLLFQEIEEKGLDVISPFQGHPGDFALPRKLEWMAAVNRLRTLKIKT